MKTKLYFALALLLVVLLCGSAFAAKIVPATAVSAEPVEDGTYNNVCADFCVGSDTTLIAEIWADDYYDAALVEALQVGDSIKVSGEAFPEEIRSIEAGDDGAFVVNNDGETDGEGDPLDDSFLFCPEENGMYTLRTYDAEYDAYIANSSLQRTALLELADTVHVVHFGLNEAQDGYVDGAFEADLAAADVKAEIESDEGLFGCMAYSAYTVITVADGKITALEIKYSE